MSRLLDEFQKDPSAVFEFGADLPSGNTMRGTIGPLIGNRLLSQIGFSMNPASDEDIALAKHIFDELMGEPAAFVQVSRTQQERESAQKLARRFMGGDQG